MLNRDTLGALNNVNRAMGEQTTHIGLRVPSDLYSALEARKGTDGRTLTDVVITLLNRGLKAVEQGTPSDLSGILQRLNNVEQRLTALESDRTATAPSLDCRSVEDEPNDTLAPPAPAPRAGGEGEGETLSDSALRGRWKKAGGKDVVGAYLPWAASQGWERVGKGNRAVWRRLKTLMDGG